MDLNDLDAVNRANRLLLLGLVGSMLLHAAVLVFWRAKARPPTSTPPVELRLNASLTRNPVASPEPAAEAAPAPLPIAPAQSPEPTPEPMPPPKAEPVPPAKLPPRKSTATPVLAVPVPLGTPPATTPALPAATSEPVAAPASPPATESAPSTPTPSSMPTPSAAPGAGDSSQASKGAPAPLTADERAAMATYRLHMENMIRHFDNERTSAERTSWEGVTVLLLRVGADGGLAGLSIVTGSGDGRTDRQARAMVVKSHKEVRVPKTLEGKAFAMEFKLRFEAK